MYARYLLFLRLSIDKPNQIKPNFTKLYILIQIGMAQYNSGTLKTLFVKIMVSVWQKLVTFYFREAVELCKAGQVCCTFLAPVEGQRPLDSIKNVVRALGTNSSTGLR